MIRYSQNISEYVLTCLTPGKAIKRVGSAQAEPYACTLPVEGYSHSTPDLTRLFYAPAWGRAVNHPFSALKIDKYHLSLCVIKSEEADKLLARNFEGAQGN